MKNQIRKICYMIFLMILLTLCQLGNGKCTVIVILDITDLVQESETILIGVVDSIYCDWNVDSTVIYTYVTVDVEAYLKGEIPDSLFTFKQMGGAVGDERMWLPGAPNFEEEEEVFLFLHTGQDYMSDIVGIMQGKYIIEIDPETQTEIVRNDWVLEEKTYLDDFLELVELTVYADSLNSD